MRVAGARDEPDRGGGDDLEGSKRHCWKYLDEASREQSDGGGVVRKNIGRSL
jgi:hypothetical protein